MPKHKGPNKVAIPPRKPKSVSDPYPGRIDSNYWVLMAFIRRNLPDFFIKGFPPKPNQIGGLTISIYEVRLFMGYKERIPKLVRDFNHNFNYDFRVMYSHGLWIFYKEG